MITATERYMLIPFVQTDKGWNIPDGILYQIFEQLMSEGKFDKVFTGGAVQDFNSFLSYIKNQRNHFVFVVDNDREDFVLFAWLEGIVHGAAYGHFSGLGDRTYKPEIGNLVLDYWKSLNLLNVIIGILSDKNKVAIKLAKSLGFTEIGTIPMLCYSHKIKNNVGGTILYLLLKEV